MNTGLRLLLAAAFALVAGACEKEKPKPLPMEKVGTGLKVVPTGADPTKAPGPKGVMINMDSDEVRILLVDPKGAAAEAGFAPGDRILAGGGVDLASEDDLSAALTKAGTEKVFFEVRSGKQVLTLPLSTSNPGWLVLSGDTFKGFLLTRIQSGAKAAKAISSGPAPELILPTFSGERLSLKSLRGHPVALLFWGTFSEPSYAHLQAFDKICKQYAPRGLRCMAVDTMELFTAVGKTREYANEMVKVRKEIYPTGIITIDLFMESERQYGVSKLPTLVLVDKKGKIVGRHDGPLKDPFDQLIRKLAPILPESPIE